MYNNLKLYQYQGQISSDIVNGIYIEDFPINNLQKNKKYKYLSDFVNTIINITADISNTIIININGTATTYNSNTTITLNKDDIFYVQNIVGTAKADLIIQPTDITSLMESDFNLTKTYIYKVSNNINNLILKFAGSLLLYKNGETIVVDENTEININNNDIIGVIESGDTATLYYSYLTKTITNINSVFTELQGYTYYKFISNINCFIKNNTENTLQLILNGSIISLSLNQTQNIQSNDIFCLILSGNYNLEINTTNLYSINNPQLLSDNTYYTIKGINTIVNIIQSDIEPQDTSKLWYDTTLTSAPTVVDNQFTLKQYIEGNWQEILYTFTGNEKLLIRNLENESLYNYNIGTGAFESSTYYYMVSQQIKNNDDSNSIYLFNITNNTNTEILQNSLLDIDYDNIFEILNTTPNQASLINKEYIINAPLTLTSADSYGLTINRFYKFSGLDENGSSCNLRIQSINNNEESDIIINGVLKNLRYGQVYSLNADDTLIILNNIGNVGLDNV
jgi:hypothetical protein